MVGLPAAARSLVALAGVVRSGVAPAVVAHSQLVLDVARSLVASAVVAQRSSLVPLWFVPANAAIE